MTTSTHRLFRAESASRSLGLYIPATAATRAIGMVRGIILAQIISKNEFGLFQITFLLVNVLNPLCALGLNEGVARYVPLYETRGRLASYLRRIVPFVLAVSLLLSGAVCIAARPLGRFFYAMIEQTTGRADLTSDAWTSLTRLAAVATFATIVYFLLLSVLKGLRMFRAVSVLELLTNAVFTVLTIAVALGGWRSTGAMMLCYIGTLLGSFLLFAWPLRGLISDTDTTVLEPPTLPVVQLLRFSAWAAMAAVIWQTLQYYPMWYLQKTHGPALPAVFGSVRLVTQIVAIAAVTIVAVVQTSVTKIWESQGHAAADRRLALAYKSTSLAVLVGCVVFALAARPIMRLFPADYAFGVQIVPLSLMFFMLSGHLSFVTIHFALIERMRHLFLPWAVGLTVNMALSSVLVTTSMSPTQAIVGAAWAGSLGLGAALLVAIALLCWERRPIDRGTIVFWAAIYVLALPNALQVMVTLAVLAATLGTNAILTAEEKRELTSLLNRAWRKLVS